MEYTSAKAMEYLIDTSQFPNPACCKIPLKLALSLDIICSSRLAVFFGVCTQKTVQLLEQLMSTDKIISSCQMEVVVFIFHIILKDSNESKLCLILKKIGAT